MNISGKTKIAGIFGHPVEHSLSPAMHNAAFAHLNLDYCYVPFSVAPHLLKQAVESIRALDLAGVNVTVPHKENVLPFLDNVSEDASFIGAVNTIKNINGNLTGYNTDGQGFMQALAEQGIEVKGKRVLMVGAGGAARAVGHCLCKEASSLYLHNRGIERGGALKQHLNSISGNVLSVDDSAIMSRDFLSGMDIIVNATSLGLKSDDPLPLNASLLGDKHVVCDLIYKKTPLLLEASKAGCRTMDGLGMLLWQGVLAFGIWTGVTPPVEVMREALGRGHK